MKSSKLIEIFKNGNIVIPLYLLKNYSKFNLTMEEFVFLMYLYNLGDNFVFNPSKFSEELGLDLANTMNYIGILTDKKFIKVEVVKNEKGLMEEVVMLEDFYNKLSLITIDHVNNTTKDNTSVFEMIEKEFGRTLSPIEYEIIKAWLESNKSEEIIKEAIKEATFNGVNNLRYIDKILFEWEKSGINSVVDVENARKKRNIHKEQTSDINIDDIIDWKWFDDDE